MTPVIIKTYWMPKFYVFVILFFLAFNLRAQTWELGGSVGGAGYIGDLNERNPVKLSGISFGGFAQRNFNGYWSLKVGYNHGQISASDNSSSDPQTQARNLSFTTSLDELSLTCVFNFMKYLPGSEYDENKFSPYLFFGMAGTYFVPTATYGGVTYDLRSNETEGEKNPYPTTTFAIPFGAGAKYNFSSAWTVAADIGYRATSTNYLDDVYGLYPNTSNETAIAKMLSDPSGEKTGVFIGVPGSQRGALGGTDTYFFLQISLSFTFNTQKCYFRNYQQ